MLHSARNIQQSYSAEPEIEASRAPFSRSPRGTLRPNRPSERPQTWLTLLASLLDPPPSLPPPVARAASTATVAAASAAAAAVDVDVAVAAAVAATATARRVSRESQAQHTAPPWALAARDEPVMPAFDAAPLPRALLFPFVAAEWVPVTKLGRLVKSDRITTLEEIFLHSLPVKEAAIIDHIYGKMPVELTDEVMKIMPVQKQTTAGQRTRFKVFVAVGDRAGHLGLGVKCSGEVSIAIRAAIGLAKLSLVPIRRGYWGSRLGAPHTVPCKVTGKCGSVRVRLIPAPRGTGLVAAPATKKMLDLAGINDCYTSARGHTRTMGNFIKAIFFALRSTYAYLSPELWTETDFIRSPYQEHTEFLGNPDKKVTKVVEEPAY